MNLIPFILKASIYPWEFGKKLANGIMAFLLIIDGAVYYFASVLYSLFYKLASVQLLTNDIYDALAERIYILIAVIALFVFSFNILKALVDPDQLEKGVVKSFKSLVTSILLIILMPTIFSYVYSAQAAIFSDNLIENFFDIHMENNANAPSDDIPDYSQLSADDYCDFENKSLEDLNISVSTNDGQAITSDVITNESTCKMNFYIMSTLEGFFTPYSTETANDTGTTWGEARKYIIYTGEFTYISSFSENVVKGKDKDTINYLPIIGTIAGGFLVYVLLSFTIDIAIRSAKLAFFQVIAPIPLLLKIVPGKEGQFEKWYQNTINAFLEVFVRLIILNFIMFMMKNLINILNSIHLGGPGIGLLGKAVLIIGLFLFAKQAPKLLKDAVGIGGGNVKLGIKDKVKDAPLIGKPMAKGFDSLQGAATGALGAGWSSKMNGTGFWNGVKHGALNGARDGGNQFGKQRQSFYNDILGRKGTAGLFGDRSFLERYEAESKNKISDRYKDYTIPDLVDKTKNNTNYDLYKSNKEAELSAKWSEEIAKIKSGISTRNNTRTGELADANLAYQAAVAQAEADKKNSLEIANKRVETSKKASEEMLTREQNEISDRYKSQLDKLEAEKQRALTSGTFDKNAIDDINSRISSLNDKKESELREAKVRHDTALRDAQEKLVDAQIRADEKYSSSVKYAQDQLESKQKSINAQADKDIESAQKRIDELEKYTSEATETVKDYRYNAATGRKESYDRKVTMLEKESSAYANAMAKDENKRYEEVAAIRDERLSQIDRDIYKVSDDGQKTKAVLESLNADADQYPHHDGHDHGGHGPGGHGHGGHGGPGMPPPPGPGPVA